MIENYCDKFFAVMYNSVIRCVFLTALLYAESVNIKLYCAVFGFWCCCYYVFDERC